MELPESYLGGEIISILTRGMYHDPRDAIREYVQNGVDAGADAVDVKIRQNTIVVEDNGSGMTLETLTNAIRVGISEKQPGKDVGFMGIGIYSSFHICDRLTILTHHKSSNPCRLIIDFATMREILDEQREKRLTGRKIKAANQISLQTLLGEHIELSGATELSSEAFPRIGTRVLLNGIDDEIVSELSNFNKVSSYLQNVLPVHFDKENFEHAEYLENEIKKICDSHEQRFELIDLSLQVNSLSEKIYRPYKDADFSKLGPRKPQIEKLQVPKGEFLGIVWGCLNAARKIISNRDVRGFVLKKQGFTIGDRKTLFERFSRGSTMWNRYSGEVIIVNRELIPNAPRTGIEWSPIRGTFYDKLQEAFRAFSVEGDRYQNSSIAGEELNKWEIKVAEENGSFNTQQRDPEILVTKKNAMRDIANGVDENLDLYSVDLKPKARRVKKTAKALQAKLQDMIDSLASQPRKGRQGKQVSLLDIAEGLSFEGPAYEGERYESLVELLQESGFDIDERLAKALDIIDEQYLGRDESDEYQEKLIQLRSDFPPLD